jgi:hypothetical protein
MDAFSDRYLPMGTTLIKIRKYVLQCVTLKPVSMPKLSIQAIANGYGGACLKA